MTVYVCKNHKTYKVSTSVYVDDIIVQLKRTKFCFHSDNKCITIAIYFFLHLLKKKRTSYRINDFNFIWTLCLCNFINIYKIGIPSSQRFGSANTFSWSPPDVLKSIYRYEGLFPLLLSNVKLFSSYMNGFVVLNICSSNIKKL